MTNQMLLRAPTSVMTPKTSCNRSYTFRARSEVRVREWLVRKTERADET